MEFCWSARGRRVKPTSGKFGWVWYGRWVVVGVFGRAGGKRAAAPMEGAARGRGQKGRVWQGHAEERHVSVSVAGGGWGVGGARLSGVGCGVCCWRPAGLLAVCRCRRRCCRSGGLRGLWKRCGAGAGRRRRCLANRRPLRPTMHHHHHPPPPRPQVVYETLPGWQSDISKVREWEDLPQAARDYVQRIEDLIGESSSCACAAPCTGHARVFMARPA